MNQIPPASPQGGPVGPESKASRIDSLFENARENPSRYFKSLLILAIPVVVVVVGYQFWKTHRQSQTGAIATKWSQTWNGDATPKARAAQLEELGGDLDSPDYKAM